MTAAVATFTVVDTAVLRAAPFKNAEQLVQLRRMGDRAGWTKPEADIRLMDRVFTTFAFFSTTTAPAPEGTLAPGEEIAVGRMSPALLELLGVAPTLGRAFTAHDALSDDVALISAGLWSRAYGSSTSVVGRSIAISGRVYTIVGVVPNVLHYAIGVPGWSLDQREKLPPDAAFEHDVWLPLLDGTRAGEDGILPDAVARLRSGVSAADAKREAKALSASQAIGTTRIVLSVLSLDQLWPRPPRTALVALSGAVALVLLIACANVSSMMLLRSLSRQHETAIRASLGATRTRLVRCFVLEGVALAGVSGLASAIVAQWLVSLVPVVAPFTSGWLFARESPTVDLRILLFGLLLALAVGVTSGGVVAVRGLRHMSLGLAAGQQIIGVTKERRAVARALQTLQTLLTTVLVAAFVVLFTSFVRIVRADLGFESTNLVFAAISQRTAGLGPIEAHVLRDVLTRVRQSPTVRAALLAPNPVNGHFVSRVTTETSPHESSKVLVYRVPFDYFAFAGIPLVVGRGFGVEDEDGAPVAVVSESAARHLWPGVSAIGQRFREFGGGWISVVGVCGNVKTASFPDPDVPHLQVWLVRQRRDPLPPSILIRTGGGQNGVLAALPLILSAVDSRCYVRRAGRVVELYGETQLPARFYAFLGGLLAGGALVTTGVGLYALASFSVRQRTKEIGLRVALGARPTDVRRIVVREAVEPVGVGLVIGLSIAYLANPVLAGIVYDATPNGSIPLLAAVAVVGLSAALALLRPVAYGKTIEPSVALRSE
jgi:predicted permease